MLEIRQVFENKKEYLPLLLLADEQEDMIDRYLERGDLYALYEGEALLGTCVVTDEHEAAGEGVCELKSLAVDPRHQRRGYGAHLVRAMFERYAGRFHTMLVGTGDSPVTVPFYERCGFVYSHRLKNFFVDHYDHPMYEDGVQLIDMVYLKKEL